MSQGGVLEVGVDRLDDRVTAVDLVGGDGVGVGGGEERMEAPGVEQRDLPGVDALVEVGDALRTTRRPWTCSAVLRS
jgi:hypothetical protein